MYQNYVKNGYALKVIMHVQGLKSFAHAHMKYFLLMSIKQFSKNETESYIYINGLELLKDFSGDSKAIFKNKLIATETTKMIQAKKDKNIKDSCLKKIEEYACIIDNTYNLILNSIYKIRDYRKKIYELYDKYYNFLDAEKNQRDYILIKINELQNNSLDIIWNIVRKPIKRNTEKVKTDKKKNINKYLQELRQIVKGNEIELLNTMNDIRSLIAEIKDRLEPINKKLCKVKKINKNEIESMEKFFKKDTTNITKRLREIASNLEYE